MKPALHIITRPHRSRNTKTRCNRCCSPRTHQPRPLLCAFDSACRIPFLRAYAGPLPRAAESWCPSFCVPLLLHSFLSIPPRCRAPGACGARLVEGPGEGIPGGGSAGSTAIETINRSVDSSGSAPIPMPFKKASAVMADVWSMPDAKVEPTPPLSPAPTAQASLHGNADNAVKPVATPSQRIKMAAVEATVAAAAPPVPPATNNGFSDDFYTACNKNVAEARDMAIKAAKQAGYFTAQAAAYQAGNLGNVDGACEHDAHVADATAEICADLEATAAISACVTRTAASAGAYTSTISYQYDDVAGQVKRDI